jgi:YidC/Oxa1 family membrane protein insertase
VNPFTILAPPMGKALEFFYSLIPNYGIAIILLTLVVSLLLFPMTLKQTRSMKAMQEIQPMVKKLQKEHKGNREELNKELMALYQEKGVNPAAGCLPLILQAPVWFALFRVLRVEVLDGTLNPDDIIRPASKLGEALVAGNTRFFGMDLLTTPSEALQTTIVQFLPYLGLMLLILFTSYYQQWQTTRTRTEAQKQQQESQPQGMQTAMKVLPLLMGVFSFSFPAGLGIYWAVSSTFRIGQQAAILRIDGDPRDAEKAANSKAENPDADQPHERTGRSPNASKKRSNKRRKK